MLTQQIGRGLREHKNKSTLTVVDLIGQQHRRFRFDTKLRALIDPRNGRLVDQVEQDFPYLPAGCEIKLDRSSREVILSSLRDAAGSGTWSMLVEDLRRLGDVSLTTFLDKTDRSLRTCTGPAIGPGLDCVAMLVSRLLKETSTKRRCFEPSIDCSTSTTPNGWLRTAGCCPARRPGSDRTRPAALSMLAVGIFGRRHGFASLDEALQRHVG